MKLTRAQILILACASICASAQADVPGQDPQLNIIRAVERQTQFTQQIATNTATIALAAEAHSTGLLPFVFLFADVVNRVAEDNALRFDMAHELDLALSGSTDAPANRQINELFFSMVMGKPPQGAAAGMNPRNFARQYLRKVLGLNTPHHFLPQTNYASEAGKEYSEFVNSMVAIESFNAYVLSERYADGGKQHELDQKVTHEMAGSKWENSVSTEPLAGVQRQTLLFASRNYLQQARLIEIQRDLLTAQVMANSIALMNLKVLEKQRYETLMNAPPYSNNKEPLQPPQK